MTNADSQQVWVVIPAAGIGKRMQNVIPKQYLTINDKTILEHTLDCFISHPVIAGIIVVLNTDDFYWKKNKLNEKQSEIPIYTVEGGNERSDSVMQGLDYLLMVEQLPEDAWVMVHDAARPCLLKKDIDGLLSIRSESSEGGILASPVRDTMKRATESADSTSQPLISHTEPRQNLWHALTPQLFRIGALKNALEECLEKGIAITDEASAMEAQGRQVALVEGNMSNLKITQAEDLILVELLLGSQNNEISI